MAKPCKRKLLAAVNVAALLAAALLLAPRIVVAGPMSLEEGRAYLEDKEVEEIYLALAELQAGQHPEGDAAVASFLVEAVRVALQAEDAHVAFGLAGTARRLAPEEIEPALVFAEAAVLLDLRGAAAEALDEALSHAPEDGELCFQRASLAEAEMNLRLATDLYARVPSDHRRHQEAQEGVRRTSEALKEREAALERVSRMEAEMVKRQEESIRRLAEERKADFEPMRGEYLLGDLRRAQAQARRRGRVLAFIYTVPDSACRLTDEMFELVRKELSLYSVVVLANAADPKMRRELPPVVRSAIQAGEVGNLLPKTVVVDAEMKKVLARVPYVRDGMERHRLIAEAKAAIADHVQSTMIRGR